MNDIFLTQEEADNLLYRTEKHRISDSFYDYPVFGGTLVVPLLSVDKKQEFLLDISKGRINLIKGKFQTRARRIIILARLDFGGPPHRNPDDEEIPSPHLHIYREGFGVKFAFPIPKDIFTNIDDKMKLMGEFMDYCKITLKPNIKTGLFI